jgi:hypothetical protein
MMALFAKVLSAVADRSLALSVRTGQEEAAADAVPEDAKGLAAIAPADAVAACSAEEALVPTPPAPPAAATVPEGAKADVVEALEDAAA